MLMKNIFVEKTLDIWNTVNEKEKIYHVTLKQNMSQKHHAQD